MIRQEGAIGVIFKPWVQIHGISTLLNNLSCSRETLIASQTRQLRRLVRHAFENVPLYGELLRAHGVHPRDIRTLADLALLPVTSKATFRDHPLDQILAGGEPLGDCRSYTTSGTTGRPMRVYFRSSDATWINLTWVRAQLASGARPWDHFAVFVGDKTPPAERIWINRLGFWRRTLLSTWDAPDAWIQVLRRMRPDVITGCAATLRVLAEEIERRRLREISPRIVFSVSVLLDEATRKYVQETLQTRVVDLYGSYEMGCLAWECGRCKGYHVNSDTAVFEVFRDGAPALPGESGEVVATNLRSSVMPFIRYRLGDSVTLSKTDPVCGVAFPLLAEIQGRTDDFVVLKNGRKLPPQPFYHALNPIPGVKRWRVSQENLQLLSVAVETDGNVTTEMRRAIDENLERLLGREISWEIHHVSSIPQGQSGKFRSVVSRLRASEPPEEH